MRRCRPMTTTVAPLRTQHPLRCGRVFSTQSKEEQHISTAVRKMRELQPQIVIEMRNAIISSSSRSFLPPSVVGLIRTAAVEIICLTHADLLCDKALRFQIQRIQADSPDAAVFALNLSQAEKVKQKALKTLTTALFGAAIKAQCPTAVVCGLPNAGKSSLILPLTKARTLEVRNKKSHHLPKVSGRAGMTPGTKRHILEVAGSNRAITLVDTPGVRPALERLNNEDVAFLFAAGVIEQFSGIFKQIDPEMVVGLSMRALKLHASFSQDDPNSNEAFGNLDGIRPMDYDDAHSLLDAYARDLKEKNRGQAAVHFARRCRAGDYGGLIFERNQRRGSGDIVHNKLKNEEQMLINRRSPIVCLNANAQHLVKIGTGKFSVEDTVPPAIGSPSILKKSLSSMHNNSRRDTELGEMKFSAKLVMENDDACGRKAVIAMAQRASIIETASERRGKEENKSKNKQVSSSKAPLRAKDVEPFAPPRQQHCQGEAQKILCLPEEHRTLGCLKCAGFVQPSKLIPQTFRGQRYTRAISWDDDDLLAFFSRVAEAFGGGKHIRYLVKDSLVRTLAVKRRWRSRRQAYKMYHKTLQNYPVKNEDRPRRFQSYQPVPLRLVCSRKKSLCASIIPFKKKLSCGRIRH